MREAADLPFKNRRIAAGRLAARLSRFRDRRPVVLGIPRGGIPLARVIADELDADLDVLLVHKISAPGNRELAIGAVSEDGQTYLSAHAHSYASADYLRAEAAQQKAILAERRRAYTPYRPPVELTGRTVIIVDDGVATGATALAGIRWVRHKQAAAIVFAAAVAPPDTARKLKEEADEVVLLATPEPFYSVGEFFDDFAPVDDDEVVRLLAFKPPRHPAASSGREAR